MPQIHTTCPRDCYDTCGLIATVDDAGQLVSVRGDPEHPVTRGITCGRAAGDHLRPYRNRVEAPAVRMDGELQPTDWDAALGRVARNLRRTLEEHGPEAVLFLDYAGNTGLLTQTFSQRLWHAIGATFTDQALCNKSGSLALELHYGERHGLYPEELLVRDPIVCWGFNAAVSSPHPWALIREARKRRGTRIIAVDPRRSETARAADLWIQPRPGSDVALAYAVVQQLLERRAADLDFLQQWTTGFDQLRAAAAEWPLARAAEVTGVAREAIAGLADAYAQSSASATLIGIGMQKSGGGADAVRSVSFVPSVLGQHRGWYYSNGSAWYVDRAALSGASLRTEPPSMVQQIALPEQLEAGRFKFVYIHLMNPARTMPNVGAFCAGLSRPDVFVALHETHWTPTASCADVVLPAHTYLEKDDVVVPWSHGYVQYSRQVVPPLTEGRHEIDVMRGLSERLGLRQEWLFEHPWQAVEDAFRGALEDGSFEDLRSGARLRLRRKPRDAYPTPSGKIEFASSRAVENGWAPLPVQRALRAQNGQFTWLTSATPRYEHTQFQEVYGPIPALVQIHPQDAARLGIADGATVSLSNDLGMMQVEAFVTDAVPPGVLWSPRQSVGQQGVAQNALMSSLPQEIGGGPRFNSTQVRIAATV